MCNICWDHSKGLRSSLWLFSLIYRTQQSNPKCISLSRHFTNVGHNGFHVIAFIKNINGALPKRRPKAFALVPGNVSHVTYVYIEGHKIFSNLTQVNAEAKVSRPLRLTLLVNIHLQFF